jgi:hypothetical protein
VKPTAIFMLLSPFVLIAQQNGGAWTNIGPSPAAVEAIAVDPKGTGTIFMGSIGGGVRKSVDGGITWSTANGGLTIPIVQPTRTGPASFTPASSTISRMARSGRASTGE